MPLYDFTCKKCQREFERFLRPSEILEGVTCPYCGETNLEDALKDSAKGDQGVSCLENAGGRGAT